MSSSNAHNTLTGLSKDVLQPFMENNGGTEAVGQSSKPLKQLGSLPLTSASVVLPVEPIFTSPVAGDFVTAGASAPVKFTTDTPGAKHELCLYLKPAVGTPVGGAVSYKPIDAPGGTPPVEVNSNIDIPAGDGLEYFLEVGFQSDTLVQKRHRIRVKTAPALVATATASLPPGAYPVGTTVTFIITFVTGVPPFNYAFVPKDGTSISGTLPGNPPVSYPVPYTFTTPGTYSPFWAITDALRQVPVILPAGVYTIVMDD